MWRTNLSQTRTITQRFNTIDLHPGRSQNRPPDSDSPGRLRPTAFASTFNTRIHIHILSRLSLPAFHPHQRAMRPLHELPFETTTEDELGYQLFKECFWHSSQICNSCFTRVRDVGPKVEKRLGMSDQHAILREGTTLKMEINQWFERTDYGSQEHHTWDRNKRFGTCFCLNCGSDCTANHRQKSIDELKPLAANIFKFTKKHTPHDLNHKRFGREIRDLKRNRDAQGYETEILGVAFARALKPDLPEEERMTSAQTEMGSGPPETAPAGD